MLEERLIAVLLEMGEKIASNNLKLDHHTYFNSINKSIKKSVELYHDIIYYSQYIKIDPRNQLINIRRQTFRHAKSVYYVAMSRVIS